MRGARIAETVVKVKQVESQVFVLTIVPVGQLSLSATAIGEWAQPQHIYLEFFTFLCLQQVYRCLDIHAVKSEPSSDIASLLPRKNEGYTPKIEASGNRPLVTGHITVEKYICRKADEALDNEGAGAVDRHWQVSPRVSLPCAVLLDRLPGSQSISSAALCGSVPGDLLNMFWLGWGGGYGKAFAPLDGPAAFVLCGQIHTPPILSIGSLSADMHQTLAVPHPFYILTPYSSPNAFNKISGLPLSARCYAKSPGGPPAPGAISIDPAATVSLMDVLYWSLASLQKLCSWLSCPPSPLSCGQWERIQWCGPHATPASGMRLGSLSRGQHGVRWAEGMAVVTDLLVQQEQRTLTPTVDLLDKLSPTAAQEHIPPEVFGMSSSDC
ncbi:putative Helicase Senataxin [Manis pentadactyla]|nr:putative Helicase Senataxin [Manis pentadactyla]